MSHHKLITSNLFILRGSESELQIENFNFYKIKWSAPTISMLQTITRNGKQRQREINKAITNVKVCEIIKAFHKFSTKFNYIWGIESDEDEEANEAWRFPKHKRAKRKRRPKMTSDRLNEFCPTLFTASKSVNQSPLEREGPHCLLFGPSCWCIQSSPIPSSSDSDNSNHDSSTDINDDEEYVTYYMSKWK